MKSGFQLRRTSQSSYAAKTQAISELCRKSAPMACQGFCSSPPDLRSSSLAPLPGSGAATGVECAPRSIAEIHWRRFVLCPSLQTQPRRSR